MRRDRATLIHRWCNKWIRISTRLDNGQKKTVTKIRSYLGMNTIFWFVLFTSCKQQKHHSIVFVAFVVAHDDGGDVHINFIFMK